MSRIGKILVPLLLTVPLGAGGCKPSKATASPEDYYPLIQVALGGGETASMIGRNEAIKAKNFGGCVAASVLITAFDGGGQVLQARLGDAIVIPAVDIDVSDCLAFRPSAGDESAALQGPITLSTAVAGWAPEEGAEEAPAETEPETEAEPEAEAEPEPEAEPEAEPAAFVGNEDAAALVEAIAGITLSAVLHYATKLKAANCKKGTAALGVINYVNGMIKPVADEIGDPDGKVTVPSVTIDLTECAQG